MAKDLLGIDYYSQESAKAYWSVSQYKRFSECEARALAELNGEWTDQRDNTALLVGNFVHSFFENQEAHEDFVKKHESEMVAKSGKNKGQLKTEYVKAQEMIEALKSDAEFMKFYRGEKEVAIVGEIEGVEFKGKIDCLNVSGGYFVDIKTTRGPVDAQVWIENELTGRNEKVLWFEAYGYILQMAVYSYLLEQMYKKPFTPILYAVTKEDPCDTCAIVIKNEQAMQDELDKLSEAIQRLDDVKKGQVAPVPCGKCDYCRSKQLTRRVMIF